MKKISFVLVLMTFLCAEAQTQLPQKKYNDINKWSISYALGSHFYAIPRSVSTRDIGNLGIFHHELNGRYMFNNRLGIMAGIGFNRMRFSGLSGVRTNFINTTLQGVLNLGDVIKLYDLQERLGLLLHAGGGTAIMWQKGKRQDKLLTLNIGLTPQIRLTQHWALFGDVTFNADFTQNRTFDFQRNLPTRASFFNISLGATYYIGKKGKHADWSSTSYGSEIPDNTNYKDEMDSLKNKMTETNVRMDNVNKELAAIRVEQEAARDRYNENVLKELSRDTPNEEELKVLKEVSEAIYFKLGGTEIQPYSFSSLNKLVDLMKLNSIKINIAGYTDNIGDTDINQKISQGRADAVKNYLISKGISEIRIKATGYGNAKAIGDNETSEGRSQNRRVEITAATSVEEILRIVK